LMGVEVREVRARRALSRSGIYGVDYSLNPFIGCQHACPYCYVPHLYPGLLRGRRWGAFVDVKVNLPRLLRSEARGGLTVLLSSITDPYQPVEVRYMVTRRSVEVLVERSAGIVVLTKSPLLKRDLDLLSRSASCEVGVTVTTLRLHRELEPRAPSPYDRLEALREAREAGLKTFLFLGPLIPGVVERELRDILAEARECGCGRVVVDRLRAHSPSIVSSIYERLPGELASTFRARATSRAYYESLKPLISRLCRGLGLHVDFCY